MAAGAEQQRARRAGFRVLDGDQGNAAIDAVAGPNGTVVCRSAVAQAEGCLPINIFGGAPISAATQAWVTSQGSPFQISNERQEAFSAVFNSTPFKDWAGDVAPGPGPAAETAGGGQTTNMPAMARDSSAPEPMD